MAYEVTATRRRPQQFEDLAGQEFVAETLKNSIKTKQFAHAYLFAGPRGCGKTSTARILAKALNCQNFSEPTCTPCGECESCKAITNSSSLDVIEIDGASNTSVNDVRQIKDEVMFPPTSCRYKIYIIDEVHMLSTSAFNALLKTIEEPPAHVIFIFATTELQKVPATIKSRCQQYNFRLVSTDRLKGLLEDTCREMNIQAEEEALFWIAKESGGSVRDCYTLFDQIAAFSDGHITYEKIRDKLGLLGVDRLNSLFDSCTAGNSEDVLNQLDTFLQSGISIDQLISNSTEYLRSLLLIKNGIKKESLLGQSAERYSTNVLNSWNTIQTERALSIFLQLYRDIRYSLSPRYELELAFSRLCWLKQYVSPSEVKAAIDRAHALLCSAPQRGASAQGTAQAESLNTQQNAQNAPVFSSVTLPAQPDGNVHQNAPKDDQMTQGAAAQNNLENEHTFSQTADSSMPGKSSGPTGTDSGTAVPNGLHMFSMLQNEQQGAGGGTPENGEKYQNPTAVTENPNPFYNGGAVPPDNTAAAANCNDNYSYDDLGNPETNDIPDEEWSTTDNSHLEEEIVESYEASVDAQQSTLTQEDVHLSNAPAALSDGSQINLKDLYEQLISKLTPENPMASSALMQTSPWILNGNTIKTSIESEFQLRSIESSLPQINGILSNICGTQISFEITKKEQPQKKEDNIPVPPQVQMLCSVFKGSIVGGKK